MTSSPVSTAMRLGAGVLGATTIALASAAIAGAHVTISPSEGAAGSYAVLTLSVPHGCDGSATTEVAIQIPEQILTVTPSVNPNWTVEKVMADLDTPVTDSHGTEITQRVSHVVYTALAPPAGRPA